MQRKWGKRYDMFQIPDPPAVYNNVSPMHSIHYKVTKVTVYMYKQIVWGTQPPVKY